MLLPAINHWTSLINFIIQNYFLDAITTCIIWNKNIDFELQPSSNGNYSAIINIHLDNLEESLKKDVYNFDSKRAEWKSYGLVYDAFLAKLTVAIEHTHCEGFVVFQESIPKFAQALEHASIISLWSSQRTKFLFAYRRDIQHEDYFNDFLFMDQPNILVIEAETQNSNVFELKTNKFVGPMHEHPEQLYLLQSFNASEAILDSLVTLYPYKLQDLAGREIIVGMFDYRPFVVIDFHKEPQVKDRAADNPKGGVYVDGTEVRNILTFCELHNCSVQVDTTEKENWGNIYANVTGDGLVGFIMKRKCHLVLAAFFAWDSIYSHLDMSTFLGRSGVTCLVPAPTRITSWTLPIRPFQYSLWLAICALLIVETISLSLTHYMEHLMDKDDYGWRRSLQFASVSTLKLVLSQNTHHITSSISLRTLLLFCYLIDIIITSIYGAGLAAILTLPTLEEAADSVERLRSHGLEWTASSAAWIVTIEQTDEPLISSLLENFRVNSFDEIRTKAKTENMGFVLERLTFGHFGNSDFITPEALQRLKLMEDDIYFQYTVTYMPRLWAFSQQYNDFIYAWHSSGFDKIWEWKVTANFLNVKEQEQVQESKITTLDTGPVKLDISNFAGLISLWVLGIIASFIAFGLELLYSKYFTSHQRRVVRRSKIVWK